MVRFGKDLGPREQVYLEMHVEGRRVSTNVILSVFRVKGEIKITVEDLRRAWDELVRVHPVLDCRYQEMDGEWRRVHTDCRSNAALFNHCVRGFESSSPIHEVSQSLDLERSKIFYFDSPESVPSIPLWRVFLFTDPSTGTQHIALLIHHLIADGRSIKIISQDLNQALLDLFRARQSPFLLVRRPHLLNCQQRK